MVLNEEVVAEKRDTQTKSADNSMSSSGGSERMDLFSPSTPSPETGTAESTSTTTGAKTIYSRQNRFISKLSKKRVIPFAIVAILLVGGGTIFAISRASNRGTNTVASNTSTALLNMSDNELGELPEVLSQSVSSYGSVVINGPLVANNSLILTPSDRPETASAGQIYFDADLGSFVFYDGTNYQTVSTGQSLAQLQEQQQIQTADLIENQVGQAVTAAINQLPEFEEVELTAGPGITVDGFRISNSGVTSLQGTPNQILLSASTGNITVSLPQDIHQAASPTFAGANLGTLEVTGNSDLNSLTLLQALGISSGGTGTDGSGYDNNGVFYYDGSKFATAAASAGGQCFVSSALGAPQFVPCNTLDVGGVRSLNGLTGVISIANADTAGSTITLRDATTSNSGLLSATNQRIAGLKTFTGGIELSNNGSIISDGSFSLQPATNNDLTLATSGSGDIILSNFNCAVHGNGGKLTVDNNGTLMCAEDTGGDGVGLVSIQPANPSVVIDVTDGANPAIAVNLKEGGGLEVGASGVSLLESCTNEQVLKYSEATSSWICAADIGEDNTDDPCPTCVVLQEESPGTPQEGNISITGTLVAGGAGIAGHATISGNTLIKTAVDSEDAFMVQNTIGAELVRADTDYMSVTIGSLASPTKPRIGGSLPTAPIGSLGTGTNGSASSVSEPKAVAIRGSYSYTAIGTRNVVQIADVSNPESPEWITELGIGANSNPSDVVTYGDYLYVLARGTSLVRVYDISEDPILTTNVSNVAIQGAAESMTLHNNYLFIASGNSRLQVLDISNPASPSVKYTVVTAAGSDGVAIKDNHAYVTQWSNNQLQIFDISDLQNSAPTSVGTVATNSGPRRIAISGNYAYVVNSTAGNMQTFDISDPASPQAVDSIGTGAHPYSVHVTGSVALVATYSGKSLQVFTLSNPADPELAGSIPSARNAIYVTFANGHAFVTGANNGLNGLLEIYSLGGNSETLTVHGNTTIGGRVTATGADFSGNVSVGTLNANTTVQANTSVLTPLIDTAMAGALQLGTNNATAINLNQNTTLGVGKTLTVQGETTITASAANALLIKDGDDNSYLQVDTSSQNISIGTTSAPTGGSSGGGDLPTSHTGSINLGGIFPLGVEVDGDYAYAVGMLNFGPNFIVMDISDPHNPVNVGSATTSAFIGSLPSVLAVEDGHAYVVADNNFDVYDVTNPSSPSRVSNNSIQDAASSFGVDVSGNYAFVVYRNASNHGYINVLDLSNKSAPSTIHSQFLGFNTTELYIEIEGDYAYIARRGSSALYSEIIVLDISNPAGGNLPLKRLAFNGNAVGTMPQDITVKNGFAYIPFSDAQAMQVFDATDHDNAPVPKGSVSISSTPMNIAVSDSGKFVYLTDGIANTLRLINVTDPDNPTNIGTVAAGSQTEGVAVSGGTVYVASRGNNLIYSYDFGTSSIAPSIHLNQNTVLTSGRSLTTQGNMLVKTDSANAFDVQSASGSSLLAADTENGMVTVSGDMLIKTDSATALDIQAADGTSLLSVDTTDGTITVGAAITFEGAIIINSHIVTGGEAPTATALSAAGTGASCSVDGNDTSGTVTVTIGSSGSSPGDICELTFSSAFALAPRPIIGSANSQSSDLDVFGSATTTKLTIGIAGTPVAETEYTFNYWNPQ